MLKGLFYVPQKFPLIQGRQIAIIGAGQAGLQLGIELLKSGLNYSVSLFTNRTSEQVRQGKILSSQGMFNSALHIERQLGLNFWDSECPRNQSIRFTLANPETPQKMLYWQGMTTQPYQSVDQRLKFSRWMEEFERLGGHLQIQDVGIRELNEIAPSHDLTVVAGGKGEISQAFPRNNIRSHFDKPQRSLACLYVKNVIPDEGPSGVHVNIIPGVGEFFMMPGLTLNGHCEMMLFEGIPGGFFDVWQGLTDPEEQLQKAIELLGKYLPWEKERCKYARLTDSQGTLVGRYTPTVRHPTFILPCGRPVLGLGDTVVLNDPIAGQGANNACKAAHHYAMSIMMHPEKSFDRAWMQATFESHWHHSVKWATKWTHLLLMPPAPYIIDVLKTAERSPSLANTLANGFDEPITLFPWMIHPEEAIKVTRSMETMEEVADVCKP